MSTLTEKLEAERKQAQYDMDHYPGVVGGFQYAKGRRDVCIALLADHAKEGELSDNEAFRAALEDFAKNHPTMDSYAIQAFCSGWVAKRDTRPAPAAPDALREAILTYVDELEESPEFERSGHEPTIPRRQVALKLRTLSALAPRKEGEG